MALNVNIIGRDSEGNLRALKVNSEGNLEISGFSEWGESLQDISDNLDILVSSTRVLYVTLVNAVAFTTDDSISYSLKSLLNLSREQFAQIKSLTLIFYDTHDASGRVLLTAGGLGGSYPQQYRIYENESFFTPGTTHRQLGNFPGITSEHIIDLPCLAGSKWTDIQLNIKFDTAPTSGTLTIAGIVEF